MSKRGKMSLVKAFLSYSSKDKEFVKAIAQELGRQHCVFDEQAFITGDEFKKSIENGLDASSTFVLFASTDSLSSDWVNIEIEEAWYKKLERQLKSSLVYLITDSVNLEQLPNWLKRAKVQYGNVPKVIAREIRSHLEQLVEERKNPFVGRSQDIQTLQEVLTPADASSSPHVFFVTGLPGIGRRSLIQKVVPESLNLKPLRNPIRLGEGFSIQDICSYVADLTEPYSTDSGFKRIMQDIQNLSKESALKRTVNNLRRMTNNGELPIFLDEGGLFDSDGNISDPVQSIIQALSPNDEAYIAIISSRRPTRNNQSNIARVYLNPLASEERKILIRTLDRNSIHRLSKRKKYLEPNEVSELADYTAGYPPSAYAAMELVDVYGIDLVLADKTKFVGLRIDHFFKLFSKENFSEEEKDILCLLASYSPLPLNIIASTFAKEMRHISKFISHLIDLSFVVVEDKLYRIADPIEDSAIMVFGLPSFKVVNSLAEEIIKLIDNPDFEEQRLDLHRILYRSSWYVKDKEIVNRVIFLFNDLIKTIKTLYDQDRNYSKVVEATEIARGLCKSKSDYETVLKYKVKALIHQEKWKDAEREIENFKNYAPSRDSYYLLGFLNRKRKRIKDAIEYYLESCRLGRNDESLNRELGTCYFLDGQFKEANKYVQEVLIRQKNRMRLDFYSVDLQAQIAIALKEDELARSSIAQLRTIDEIAYYHRKSRYESSIGNKFKAENDARKAFELSINNPRFHISTQLAFCAISIKKTAEAERLLNIIDQRFGKINYDVRKGLRTRLAIAQERYKNAVSLSNEIMDKSTKSYKGIRRDALQGFLNKCSMPDIERAQLNIELDSLHIELMNVATIEFIPEVDNYLDID
jgi:tetratricopeptide (TPR) repeat protein